MFQPPSLIALAIAATRMHRSLTDFGSVGTDPWDILAPSAHTVDDNLLNSNSNVSKLHQNQTLFNQVQVTVDTSSDASRLSRTRPHDLYIMTEKPWQKPNRYHVEPRPLAGELV